MAMASSNNEEGKLLKQHKNELIVEGKMEGGAGMSAAVARGHASPYARSAHATGKGQDLAGPSSGPL